MDKRIKRWYSIHPIVVPISKKTKITIEGLYKHSYFRKDTKYFVQVFPCEQRTKARRFTLPPFFEVKAENNSLTFEYEFDFEQEYMIKVCKNTSEDADIIERFCVFALQDDLFSLNPYKGDLHCHSTGSDGEEDPTYLPAAYRNVGCDFLAITDHRNYFSSVEAEKCFRETNMEMQIFHGEEVHPPCDLDFPDGHNIMPIHSLNLGADISINEYFMNNEEEYRAQIQKTIDSLSIPDDVNDFQYATCYWIYNKIREHGGISVFCHPFWKRLGVYDISIKTADYIMEQQPFDAFELTSGYYTTEAGESADLQLAYYMKYLTQGKKIPIVGVSDTHGCDGEIYFDWYYTIAFSKSNKFEDIKNAIMDFKTVAVMWLPNENPHVYGSYRLVKFAHFLLREYFPYHNKLC